MSGNNGQVDAVAQVYATSLFELAERAGGMESIASLNEELEGLAELLESNTDLSAFFSSRIIAADERNQSLQRMFGDGRVSDLLLRSLLVLNRKERLGRVVDIAAAYRKLYWERLGRVEIEAITASPMDEAQTEQVRSRIQKVLGKEPMIRNIVDPTMIGGLKLRIGDQLIDASVASQLRRLQDQLRRSGAETIRGRLRDLIDDSKRELEPV